MSDLNKLILNNVEYTFNDTEIDELAEELDSVKEDVDSIQVINGRLYIKGTAYELGGVGIRSIVKTGTSGLVDTYTITMTDGTTNTFTVTNGDASDAKIQGFIEDWLDEHPDATTTVEDGAISEEKLTSELQEKLNAVHVDIPANSYKFTEVGQLYTPPSNYVAWGQGPKWDKNLMRFVHMLFCAPKHIHATSTWQRVLIDPITFETDTPTRVKFYESDGETEIVFDKEADGNSWRMMDDVAGHYQAIKVRNEGGANYKYKYNSYDYGLTWIQDDTRLIMPTGGLDSIEFRLSNGRLLTSYGGPILYSDDDGYTWRQVTPATAGGNYEAECAFIELDTKGTVMAIARYSIPGGAFYGDGRPDPAIISYSHDYGTSWSGWQASSSIIDMNAIGCTALKHDGFVELLVSSRWYDGINKYAETGKRGCVYHYVATIEDALNDNFTNLGIVHYAKGSSGQDLMAGELALDGYGEGLLCVPDSADGRADTCAKWYYKAVKQTYFSKLDDNTINNFSVFSNNKVTALMLKQKMRILSLVNNAIRTQQRIDVDPTDDPKGAFTYLIDGLVANFDFLDSSSYDSANKTITDTEHGIIATFRTGYNNFNTNADSLPTIRDNSVSLCFANLPSNWGASYFDSTIHDLTFEYSYYLETGESLPFDEYYTAFGHAGGRGSFWQQGVRKLFGKYSTQSFSISGTNTWFKTAKRLNHCVYVFGSDGSAKFYINGILQGTTESIADFTGWQSGDYGFFTDTFNICGFSRSARIYNKALSENEILNNYYYEINRLIN